VQTCALPICRPRPEADAVGDEEKTELRCVRGRGAERGAPPLAFGSVATPAASWLESRVRDLTGGARGCPAPRSPYATAIRFSAAASATPLAAEALPQAGEQIVAQVAHGLPVAAREVGDRSRFQVEAHARARVEDRRRVHLEGDEARGQRRI